MLDWLTNPQTWIALVTLTSLEVVLGVDNVIFISILSSKLHKSKQARARRLGLFLAMFMRIALLLTLSWIMRLTQPLFAVLGHAVSGRDLILLAGGVFLIAKATWEIHDKLEGVEGERSTKAFGSYGAVLAQNVALDVIFSLGSVFTAVGMVNLRARKLRDPVELRSPYVEGEKV